MPYHVTIYRNSNPGHEIKLDLSEEDLQSRFIRPYNEGRGITINGTTIPTEDIKRIRINQTDAASHVLFPYMRQNAASRRMLSPNVSYEMKVTREGNDVTDQFIDGPPGIIMSVNLANTSQSRDARKVFVIHGRNNSIRSGMFAFLRSIGLEPLEWSAIVAMTGSASPYIGQILDTGFSHAQAVVVLMTPDDEARLLPAFKNASDPLHETNLTPQPRPNVLYEAGMAMGKDDTRTVLVEFGTLRPFSDAAGRHAIRMDGSTQKRQELADRLRNAGCSVSLFGTDWHTAGDLAL